MVRCQCKKTDGLQCTREAKTGLTLCWQHEKCTSIGSENNQSLVTESNPQQNLSKMTTEVTGVGHLINDLTLTSNCNLNGFKVIPFLIRMAKTIPGRLCNLRNGIGKKKLYNSVVILNFGGSIVQNEPILKTPSNLSSSVSSCQEPIVIIHLVMTNTKGEKGHSNLLVIDRVLKEIERFEPNGNISKSDPNNRVNTAIVKLMKVYFPKYVYIHPLDYCPIHGSQKVHGNNKSCSSGGYCAAWSTLYGHLRILNPNLRRQDIITYMIESLSLSDILKYTSYIDQIVTDQEILDFQKGVERYT